MTEERVAEAAAESIGHDTPISWEKCMKMIALLFILVASNIIGAGGMAITVPKLVGWFDEYQEEAKIPSRDQRGYLDDVDEATENDIWLHLVTLLYSWL